MIEIPTNIQTVPQPCCDRLLEKQFQAKIRLRGSVFAMALNNRWKHEFKERSKWKCLSIVK